MKETEKRLDPPDLGAYHQNRRNFPLEELARYPGRYVAFSPDGTRILASGDSEEEMEEELERQGIHPSQVVGSYVDPPDLGTLG
jgi:hypothetical protein